MLQDIPEKIKVFSRKWREEIIISLIILLVALLAFGLGRLSVLYEREGGFEIIYPENSQGASAIQAGGLKLEGGSKKNLQPSNFNLPPPLGGGGYIASKTGAKYHLPWCSGAQRIKEENKIYFETKEAAERAGYTPAGNCKGI